MAAALRAGAVASLSAYLLWGVSGIYFKVLEGVPAIEILAHRMIWSVVLTALAVWLRGQWGVALAILRQPRKLGIFVASAALIALNWGVFIWAIQNEHALEASLGYFMNPIVAVALGAIVLRERLSLRQILALALVVSGVGYMLAVHGEFPWVALILAHSFAFYGLLRKLAPAESLVGLFLETLLLSPLALLYIALLGGGAFFSGDLRLPLLLLMAGPITTGPLLLFAFGARRLRLSTMGILFYVNPSVQLVVAIFLFGEPFTEVHQLAFPLVWAGVLVYIIDPAWLKRRSGKTRGD